MCLIGLACAALRGTRAGQVACAPPAPQRHGASESQGSSSRGEPSGYTPDVSPSEYHPASHFNIIKMRGCSCSWSWSRVQGREEAGVSHSRGPGLEDVPGCQSGSLLAARHQLANSRGCTMPQASRRPQ